MLRLEFKWQLCPITGEPKSREIEETRIERQAKAADLHRRTGLDLDLFEIFGVDPALTKSPYRKPSTSGEIEVGSRKRKRECGGVWFGETEIYARDHRRRENEPFELA